MERDGDERRETQRERNIEKQREREGEGERQIINRNRHINIDGQRDIGKRGKRVVRQVRTQCMWFKKPADFCKGHVCYSDSRPGP